ncbi:MAG TPA: family 14 glycosylhydrolase [Candidatus Obscuribacterales bacterium]
MTQLEGGSREPRTESNTALALAAVELRKQAAEALAEKKENAPAEAAAEAASASPMPRPGKSLLNAGIDSVSSLVIKDDKSRETFNHLSGEFLKTAALFARRKTGFVGAFLAYGLDQAKVESTGAERLQDFLLGGVKGSALKGTFSLVASSFKFAPTKGILIGIASRDAEVIFNRQSLADPSKMAAGLKAETLNPQAWLFDGAVFLAGEGMFSGINKAMGGRLVKNELAAGMVMGGSFGVVNGGTAEIVRQAGTGKPIDWGNVAYHAALEGGVGSLGAGFGMKVSDPKFHQSLGGNVRRLKETGARLLEEGGFKHDPLTREFVLVGGKERLDAFSSSRSESTMVNVRELTRKFGFKRLGETKQLYVQRNTDGQESIRPSALQADLIATCYPETLTGKLRSNHVFPNGRGPVWLEVGDQGHLRVSIGETPYLRRRITPLGRLVRLDGHEITMNVMGPLEVGNSRNPDDPNLRPAWEAFERDLAEAKRIGVDAVSTDVWWGVIHPRPGKFNWSYYDRLSQTIMRHGLKWVPILSFHQAGGNVGDNTYIPVPAWVWNKMAMRLGSSNPDAAKFVSEQGNASHEYISFWATKAALPYYRAVMRSFQIHFADKAPGIAEINISLGPSGELRYPSYNSHDKNSSYPTRGALQAYSELARQSFREFAIKKYGDEAKAREAWGVAQDAQINPPSDATAFFERGDHFNTKYGRDFIDWYHQSLTTHGRLMLGTALDVFASKGAPFAGIDVGAKIPGVHWRVGTREGDKVVLGDRLAELNAGLITTSRGDWNSDADGRGYRSLLSVFKDADSRGALSRVVAHFTALEMADGHEGPSVKSLPYTLAKWVGEESRRQGVMLKGENALAWTLPDHGAWDRMMSHLYWGNPDSGHYYGLTLLRMSDVINNQVAKARLIEIVNKIKAAQKTDATPTPPPADVPPPEKAA